MSKPYYVFASLALSTILLCLSIRGGHAAADDLRVKACAVIDLTVNLTHSQQAGCEENDYAYFAALAKVADLVAPTVTKNLNSFIEEVNHASSHVDAAKFTATSMQDFAASYRMIGINQEDRDSNAALDFAAIKATGIRVDMAYDAADAETLFLTIDGPKGGGSSNMLIPVMPQINETIDENMGFTCYDIAQIDGGCQGTLYLRTHDDGISLVPTVVGIKMDRASQNQAREMVMEIFAPSFEEGSAENDRLKMKEFIDAFDPQ